jgi:transposase
MERPTIPPTGTKADELFSDSPELVEAQKEAVRQEVERTRRAAGWIPEPEAYNFRDYDQRQAHFVVIRFSSFLEPDHPARMVDLVVERMDLSRLYESYSAEGKPPFHPKMMLKVLFYGYYKAVMSCRTLWDVVEQRADFIYLAAGQVPNFRTINSFRLRHLEIMAGLFTQIVMLCQELGMVGFEHLAIDGQKIQANASYRRSKNLEQMEKEYAKVRAGMEKLLGKEVNEDFPQELKEKRLGRLEEKAAGLEELKRDLQALEDEKARLNMSDKDAPIMRHKDGTSVPSYNHQSATDGLCGVVCAVQTTQENDRPKDLLPLVDQAKENTGGEHAAIIADCGFNSYEVMQTIEEERTEEFYVPDRLFESSKNVEEEKSKYSMDRFERMEDGGIRCPQGQEMKHIRRENHEDGHQVDTWEGTACGQCAQRDKCTSQAKRRISVDSREGCRSRMREKLLSDKGREIYMKRQGIAEAVHGDDQRNHGWRQHHLRRLAKATGEFLLMRIATNLRKIVKYRSQEFLTLVMNEG